MLPVRVLSFFCALLICGQQAAAQGPVRNLRIAQQGVTGALAVAHLLDSLKQAFQASQASPWLDPFRRAALLDPANAWYARLHELLAEMSAADTERAQLMRRAVTVPEGLLDNFDARCPSSDNLRLVRRFEKGGSRSPGLESKRPAADAASGGLASPIYPPSNEPPRNVLAECGGKAGAKKIW